MSTIKLTGLAHQVSPPWRSGNDSLRRCLHDGCLRTRIEDYSYYSRRVCGAMMLKAADVFWSHGAQLNESGAAWLESLMVYDDIYARAACVGLLAL